MGRVPGARVRQRRVSVGSCRETAIVQIVPPALANSLPAELRARSAVLDGEIVALDRRGKTQFKDLLFGRGEPRFYFSSSSLAVSPLRTAMPILTVSRGLMASTPDRRPFTSFQWSQQPRQLR